MHRHRRAKIVATVGPASASPEVLKELFLAGVDTFRLNFSHGTHEDHARVHGAIRALERAVGRPIGILQDLQGPKIRIGVLRDGGFAVAEGESLRFVLNGGDSGFPGDRTAIPLPHPEIFAAIAPGQDLLIDDGRVRVRVTGLGAAHIDATVIVGGALSNRKGVNLPGTVLDLSPLTPKDRADLAFGLALGMDWVALSFVQKPGDLIEARGLIGERAGLVAKIEKPSALAHIDDIVRLSDAVMVARGDLGVEIPPEEVPGRQKELVRACRLAVRPVIVATQMLDSMVSAPTPTRAEASDVANAVFDGAGAVMLSGETAMGKHPSLVVETMVRIIQVAEARIDQLPHAPTPPEHLEEHPYRSAAMAEGAWHIARRGAAKVVIVWSQIGGMARYLSQNDFRIPIVACTSNPVAARRMCLLAGVRPLLTEPPASGTLKDWTDQMEAYVKANALASDGDAVILIAGKPLGSTKSQDVLSILRVGDPESGFRAR